MKLNNIVQISSITIKGGIRDRVFLTLLIISIACFLVFVPSVSSMSMRQVREVATGISLSIISLITLVITVFGGINLVYKDVEKRFISSVLSMPVSRDEYIIGKFLGLSGILGLAFLILAFFSCSGIMIASKIYQTSIPMVWENYIAALFFDYLSLTIISSILIFFSTFSTTVFVPLFASLGFYFAGNITEQVMEYIKVYGERLPSFSVYLSKIAYYIFPNLTAFDLKFNAIYGIPLSAKYLLSVLIYGFLYACIVLCLSLLIFRRRQIP